MSDGSHPPFSKFKVKCVGKSGLTLSFMSEEVSIDATFTKQEDADYFTVEGEYAVDFRPAGAGESGGGN